MNDGSVGVNLGRDLGTVITAYLLPMICVVAIVWALWVGLQWITSKEEAGRRNARKRFVSSISCVLIFVILSGMLFALNLALPGVPVRPDQNVPRYPAGGGGFPCVRI